MAEDRPLARTGFRRTAIPPSPCTSNNYTSYPGFTCNYYTYVYRDVALHRLTGFKIITCYSLIK